MSRPSRALLPTPTYRSVQLWSDAATDFFEAFKSYDEAGAVRRVACLKYLVLASMLMESKVRWGAGLCGRLLWPSRLVPGVGGQVWEARPGGRLGQVGGCFGL